MRRLPAAFIKELMRRVAQASIARGGGTDVQSRDIAEALDDMLFTGGKLNIKLLGGALELADGRRPLGCCDLAEASFFLSKQLACQSNFARAKSARSALVACTIIIPFSAAASSAALASSWSD